MNIVFSAALARNFAEGEHVAVLKAMPDDATFDNVLEDLGNDALADKSLYIQQVRAFWNAQNGMVRNFRSQARHWGNIVETLRAEIDGLRPE